MIFCLLKTHENSMHRIIYSGQRCWNIDVTEICWGEKCWNIVTGFKWAI